MFGPDAVTWLLMKWRGRIVVIGSRREMRARLCEQQPKTMNDSSFPLTVVWISPKLRLGLSFPYLVDPPCVVTLVGTVMGSR